MGGATDQVLQKHILDLLFGDANFEHPPQDVLSGAYVKFGHKFLMLE